MLAAVGSDHRKTEPFDPSDRCGDGSVALHANPSARACGGLDFGRQCVIVEHRVELEAADGIGTPENGGDVMRFVDALHHHREVGLALR